MFRGTLYLAPVSLVAFIPLVESGRSPQPFRAKISHRARNARGVGRARYSNGAFTGITPGVCSGFNDRGAFGRDAN